MVKKLTLAAHCASLTTLWFEVAGNKAFQDDSDALFQMTYEQTDIREAKGNDVDSIPLGSEQFYMNAKKSDLIIFVIGMQLAINDELKKKL